MSDMRGHARKALAALRQFVETQVLEGHWPPGTQLPTERELADQFAQGDRPLQRRWCHGAAQEQFLWPRGQGSQRRPVV